MKPSDRGDVTEIDWQAEAAPMILAADVLDDHYASLAAWILDHGPAEVAADLGAGVGGLTCALAAASPQLRVYAVDPEPAMRAALTSRAQRLSLDDRVTPLAQPIDAVELPAAVDILVAAHVVHHLPDQRAALADLQRHLAPGGRLVLVEGGLDPSCLPWDLGVGRPGLETRLAAASSAWFEDHRRHLPGAVPATLGWSELLRAADWTVIGTRTFLTQHHPPLPELVHGYVAQRFDHLLRRRGLDRYLEEDDIEALRRLTDRSDDAYLGRRQDLHYLVAFTAYAAVPTIDETE